MQLSLSALGGLCSQLVHFLSCSVNFELPSTNLCIGKRERERKKGNCKFISTQKRISRHVRRLRKTHSSIQFFTFKRWIFDGHVIFYSHTCHILLLGHLFQHCVGCLCSLPLCAPLSTDLAAVCHSCLHRSWKQVPQKFNIRSLMPTFINWSQQKVHAFDSQCTISTQTISFHTNKNVRNLNDARSRRTVHHNTLACRGKLACT